MAKLQEIATLLDIEIDLKNKARGKKRRAWIEEKDSSIQTQQNNESKQMGPINPVYKPHSSTPFR